MNLSTDPVDENLEMRVLSYLFDAPDTELSSSHQSVPDGTSDNYDDAIGVGETQVLDILSLDVGAKRTSRLFSADDFHSDVQSPKKKRSVDFLPNVKDEDSPFLQDFDIPANTNKSSSLSPRTALRRRRTAKVRTSPNKSLRKQALTKAFESLDKKQIEARTEVRTIVARKPDEIVKKRKRRKHKRGSYVCKLCGLPKKNHKCVFAPKVKPKKTVRVKKYVSIGTQCEIDEDMTIVAMKRDENLLGDGDDDSSLIHAMEETNLL